MLLFVCWRRRAVRTEKIFNGVLSLQVENMHLRTRSFGNGVVFNSRTRPLTNMIMFKWNLISVYTFGKIWYFPLLLCVIIYCNENDLDIQKYQIVPQGQTRSPHTFRVSSLRTRINSWVKLVYKYKVRNQIWKSWDQLTYVKRNLYVGNFNFPFSNSFKHV